MRFGFRYFDSVDSTNDMLARLLESGDPDEGTVIQSGYQTAGKGHGGNSWQSEAGRNLLFSVLLKPGFLTPDRQFDLSRIVSLALHDLLRGHCPGTCIKWPNDLLVGDRKIAGILIENTLKEDMILHSIAGVGINVNQSRFSPEIPSPTSMMLEKGCHFDMHPLLNDFTEFLDEWYRELASGNRERICRAYLDRLYRFGTWTGFHDGKGALRGRIKDVLPGGELVVETEDGEQRRFGFKEIRFMP